MEAVLAAAERMGQLLVAPDLLEPEAHATRLRLLQASSLLFDNPLFDATLSPECAE